jgi:Hydroxymethylpyrimidine/phosphomethylpyrimidine kinase
VVLLFAGSDPSGGAGIQADIQTISSLGCHPAPVITAVTVQDTRDVQTVSPLEARLVMEQACAVLKDMPVSTMKVGLLGSVPIVEALSILCNQYPHIPLVFDPILASGGGTTLANDALREAMIACLVPFTRVLTPNSLEARALVPDARELDECGLSLVKRGCEFVLITGCHEPIPQVVNTLYGKDRILGRYAWARLEGSFHGSGCTLASSIAGHLAQGLDPLAAIERAQAYTWRTLKHAIRVGRGQHLPNRFFWGRYQDGGRI